ncbi:TPA: hypothetical protein N0F65_011158 [Lagenidium giganteum]|uniref:Eukaryotic translation initiation factor 3 subunit E n=1 Tax=Lagenidium giganteum TaxID=4803 RepID=A0AAV2Z6X9_9STRA|nr:TPA: hypothetical protein N0F65_011158 [Lagenidium giganteum]
MTAEETETMAPTVAPDAKYDLTNTLAPFMDLHFMFPLIDFLSSNELYDEAQLMAAKLSLLKPTYMADFAVEIYQTLHNTTDVPAEFEERRGTILDSLSYVKSQCSPMLDLINDEEKIMQLQSANSLNAQYLEQNEGITPTVLDGLYKYAKLQYECGNYQDCLTYLTYYGVLIPNSSEQYLNALWGKLAAEILIFRWEDALVDIGRISDVIENSHNRSPVEQLQQRTWLLHWSLFVFAWHEEGRDAIVDFMLQSRSVEAIQSNVPWLLRYLSAGVILHKRRRNLTKELLRIFRVDDKTFRDPIIEFFECLFVNFDFESAQEKLRECEVVLASDFFLAETMAHFMESSRLAIFELYCRVHRTIDTKMLSEKLAMEEDGEAEKWIVNLIRNARLDAKIDSQQGLIIMGAPQNTVYRQVIEKTRDLAARTCSMVSQFERMGKRKTFQ